MARLFDDSNSEWLTVASPLLDAAPFTCCAWIKTDDGADNFQVIAAPFGAAGTDIGWKYRLRMTDVEIQFEAEDAGGSARAGATAVPAVGDWGHAASVEVAVDSRESYFAGANKGTNATSITPLASSIDTTSIAVRDDGSPSDSFSGDIGHVSLYGAALNQSMIETHAAGYNPMRIQRDNLVGYYPINGQSPEFNVMGGFDLTVVNAPPLSPEPPIRRFNVAPP